jgi:hypothetical protein
MSAPIAFPAIDTKVEYVGSVQEAHGIYRVFDDCECSTCDAADLARERAGIYATVADARMVLVDGTRRLNHVRLSSVRLL